MEPLSNSRTASKRDIERAILILHLENHPNSVVASMLNCNYLTAKHWRVKWLSFQPVFEEIENSEDLNKSAKLKAAIFEFLADAPPVRAHPLLTAPSSIAKCWRFVRKTHSNPDAPSHIGRTRNSLMKSKNEK